MELRPHDLLRLSAPAAVRVAEPPEWVAGALDSALWVVVRRAAPVAGRIPVGIRGLRRDQRCAAFVDAASVVERVVPEDLVRAKAWRTAARADLPVIRVIERLAPRLDATGLTWGVAGGAGFELATGRPVLREESDLDIIVRAGFPLPVAALQHMAETCSAATVRVDALIESRAGAFSLAEFCAPRDTLLLRGADGPRLIARAELLEAE